MEVKSALSEKISEIAKSELREEDLRKRQSLAQFREWLSKHPFIKKCRQGLLEFELFNIYYITFSMIFIRYFIDR